MDTVTLPPVPDTNGMYSENLHHMANYFSYSPEQYQAVAHVLTLGSAVFAAAIFYFVLTLKNVSPKYRITNVISLVVTVSAFFMLTIQAFSWQTTFVFNPDTGEYARKAGALFSNGFRYMNWAIDVPHLLLQLVLIVPVLTVAKKVSYSVQFAVGGLIMVIASWYAAFFEKRAPRSGNKSRDVLAVVLDRLGCLCMDPGSSVQGHQSWALGIRHQSRNLFGQRSLPSSSSPGTSTLALVQPALGAFFPPLWSSESVVARHVIFTFADITSKAVYGVLLSAMPLSFQEGGL